MSKNLVGTTYLCLGDIVKEEERRAFQQRTKMAYKVAVEVMVQITKTGKTITIGMNKRQTIGQFKTKIQLLVYGIRQPVLLQFPGGNTTDDLDHVHLWQVSTLENADG